MQPITIKGTFNFCLVDDFINFANPENKKKILDTVLMTSQGRINSMLLIGEFHFFIFYRNCLSSFPFNSCLPLDRPN